MTELPRWRRWFSLSNAIVLLALLWGAPRLLPHVGAVFGVESGASVAPEYRVVTLLGDTLSSAQLRGKVVLVNFWATWCLPCRAEMPMLQAMYRRHRDAGFVLLGLSVDRGGDAGVRRFVAERALSYPIALASGGEEKAFGGVRGYPTSFLIDRQGVVRHAVIGPLAPATLELAVRRLLRDGPSDATPSDAPR